MLSDHAGGRGGGGVGDCCGYRRPKCSQEIRSVTKGACPDPSPGKQGRELGAGGYVAARKAHSSSQTAAS